MKKNITFKRVLVSAIACTTIMGTTAFANQEVISAVPVTKTEVVTPAEKDEAAYTTYAGKVSSVSAEKDGVVTVKIDGEMGLIANLQPGTIVIDSANPTGDYKKTSELKEGMMVTCIIPSKSPMTLSMPPMSSSVKVVVIGSETKSFEVASYNEELTNKENTLKLNISETTKIVDIRGAKKVFTAEDVKNSQSLVFYSVTTRSIPAQTNPEMIMILENKDIKDKEEVAPTEPAKYVGLREEAEKLGYTVKWTSNDAPVVLEKDAKKIEVKIGETKCTANGEAKELTLATKLENGTMVVSSEVIDVLK